MTHTKKQSIKFAVAFMTLIAQGVLFANIAENKPSEVIFFILALIGLSECRIYLQKWLELREVE